MEPIPLSNLSFRPSPDGGLNPLLLPIQLPYLMVERIITRVESVLKLTEDDKVKQTSTSSDVLQFTKNPIELEYTLDRPELTTRGMAAYPVSSSKVHERLELCSALQRSLNLFLAGNTPGDGEARGHIPESYGQHERRQEPVDSGRCGEARVAVRGRRRLQPSRGRPPPYSKVYRPPPRLDEVLRQTYWYRVARRASMPIPREIEKSTRNSSGEGIPVVIPGRLLRGRCAGGQC